MKTKEKSNFQREIERDEERLGEIYNKILKIDEYKGEELK